MADDQRRTPEQKQEFYLAKAQEAEDAAKHAADENERALLLQISQSWRLLAIRLA
jgi:outer membrane PBP1 activator LpoA protein